MTDIDREIAELERKLVRVGFEVRAAEIGRESADIMRAWNNRDAIEARLNALRRERDKPWAQQRAEAEAHSRDLEAHMRRRLHFETGRPMVSNRKQDR